MVPPLDADRGPLVRAKTARLLCQIGRARTTLTVRKALLVAEMDQEIPREAFREMKARARDKIRVIRSVRREKG